jgi:hypothetical protein
MNTDLSDHRALRAATLVRHAINLAGALLAASAAAVLLCLLGGAGFVAPHDPLLGVPARLVLSVYAAVAAAVALACVLGRPSATKALLVLWLTLNVVVYVVATRWTGQREIAYLADLAAVFHLQPATAARLAALAFVGMCCAGLVALLGLWLGGYLAESRKMTCPACGGHIEFALRNLGQKIPCPHCRHEVTLRRPQNLKTNCFFCQGHIEFPAHAIGQKIHCPHCKRDITLKEPATA